MRIIPNADVAHTAHGTYVEFRCPECCRHAGSAAHVASTYKEDSMCVHCYITDRRLRLGPQPKKDAP